MNTQDTVPAVIVHRRRIRSAVEVGAYAGLALLVASSAVVIKEAKARARFEALTTVAELHSGVGEPASEPVAATPVPIIMDPLASTTLTDGADAEAAPDEPAAIAPAPGPRWGPETRWFNARPVRPARTIWMTVTAYSPDAQSCGDSADGITSSIHNVWTNAMKLVAADSKVLPLGSMISVPGYDEGRVVPVLDRGGAIKGHRLDVLFPTHAAARKWGVRHIPITVWAYADGKPKDDFRKIRDSKN
jgi:3D (Asp-Asp-Asp) domain-containing protein